MQRSSRQPTNDAAAPVPIARLIDAEVYKGTDPNVTLTSAIGIAEFANANFFSEDSGYRRFLAPSYPYPSVERLVSSRRALPAERGVRAYYKKGLGDGLEVDPVLAECAMDAAFRDDGIPTPQYKCADGHVWEQTALAMLPRAVGYAAALVDYFFRGGIGAAVYENQSLRIAGWDEPMVGDFRLLYERSDGTRADLAAWTALRLDPNELSQPLLDAPAPRRMRCRCALLPHLPRSARAGVRSGGWGSGGVPARPATPTTAGRPMVCVLLRHVHRLRQLLLRDDEPAALGLRRCAPDLLLQPGIHRNRASAALSRPGDGPNSLPERRPTIRRDHRSMRRYTRAPRHAER